MASIETDMNLHRKLGKVVREGMLFCNNDLKSPRAGYFNLSDILDMRRKVEIKLLVQVPDSFAQQINELIQ